MTEGIDRPINIDQYLGLHYQSYFRRKSRWNSGKLQHRSAITIDRCYRLLFKNGVLRGESIDSYYASVIIIYRYYRFLSRNSRLRKGSPESGRPWKKHSEKLHNRSTITVDQYYRLLFNNCSLKGEPIGIIWYR